MLGRKSEKIVINAALIMVGWSASAVCQTKKKGCLRLLKQTGKHVDRMTVTKDNCRAAICPSAFFNPLHR